MLLAYVKIKLFQELLDSELPDDAFFARELQMYFPTHMRERFSGQIAQHRLSREIISTVTANGLANRMGITFAFRLGEETGSNAGEIARAYTIAKEVFEMESLCAGVEALDNQVRAQDQTYMLLESRRLVERAARWLLRNRPGPLEVRANIEHFAPGVEEVERLLSELLVSSSLRQLKTSTNKLVKAGVPEALAHRVSKFTELFSALDIRGGSERRRAFHRRGGCRLFPAGRCAGAALACGTRWSTYRGTTVGRHWLGTRCVTTSTARRPD